MMIEMSATALPDAQAETLTPEQREIRRLQHEIEMMMSAGIIEVAVRNSSVADYMQHWEGRVAALEAENAELRKDAERYRWLQAHDMRLPPLAIAAACHNALSDADVDRYIDAALAKEGK